MSKTGKMPGAQAHVTVDVVIFTIRKGALEVLLVRRGIPPFEGKWAIPGGFVLEDESLEQAAQRELKEETGVEGAFLEQFGAFGDPGRDPRGRVVTVAFLALMDPSRAIVAAGSDADAAAFYPAGKLPKLAFDHSQIVESAIDHLRWKVGSSQSNVGFELLPREFSLTDLQHVHEAILGETLDKRNFRRQVIAQDLVAPLGRVRPSGRRPAHLYRFSSKRVKGRS